MLKDRVHELVETGAPGVGSIVTTAVRGPGFRRFITAFGTDKAVYAVQSRDGSKIEIGLCAAVAAASGGNSEIARADANVGYSTNANARVEFVSGDLPLQVFCPTSAEILGLILRSAAANTAPLFKDRGTFWYDTSPAATARLLKVYDGADWITLGTLNETTNAFTPSGVSGVFALLGGSNIFTGALQIVQQTDGSHDAAAGPVIEADRVPNTPVANDLGGVFQWAFRSTTAVKRIAANLGLRVLSATNASEAFETIFRTMSGGALAERMTLYLGLRIGAPSGGDKGAGSLNVETLFVQGVPIVPGKIVAIIDKVYADVGVAKTATMPLDNSKPQNTEGLELFTIDIPAGVTGNKLYVSIWLKLGQDGGQNRAFLAAVFKDSDANSFAGEVLNHYDAAAAVREVHVEGYLERTDANAIVLKVRAGLSAAGNWYTNSYTTTALLDGLFVSRARVVETRP